ncbi:MAG: hypothetical protein MPJ50_06135 [Pirellulales bacterium]|nr:hypothetical protein [Pirellulales bacterium]
MRCNTNSQTPRTTTARLLTWSLCGLWMATALGCSSGFDMRKNIPWPELVNFDEPKTPLKMVAMWQETVKHQEGKPAIRGFGGRVLFYASDDTKPIKVDGDFDVFAFVESGNKQDEHKPDRKFVFTRDKLESHYSKNKLGHTYSFWLPWEPVGGETLQITLIARFTPVTGGGTVTSEQNRYLLPGLDPFEGSPPDTSYNEFRNQTGTSPDITQIGYFGNDSMRGRSHPISRNSQPRTIQMPRLNPASEFGYRMSHPTSAGQTQGQSAHVTAPGQRFDYLPPQQAHQQLAELSNIVQPRDTGAMQQMPHSRPEYSNAPEESAAAPSLSAAFSRFNQDRWARYANAGNAAGRTLGQVPQANHQPTQLPQNQQQVGPDSFEEFGPVSGGWTTSTFLNDPRQPPSQLLPGGFQPPRLPAQARPFSRPTFDQQWSPPSLPGQLASPQF